MRDSRRRGVVFVGLAGTSTAPQSSASCITIDQTAGSTSSSTLITHGAPVNSRAWPAAQPDCAVPAIGCPPTNRACRPAAITSSSTALFTLVTSVSGQSGADSLMWVSRIGNAGIGTASTISALVAAARVSASVRFVVASKPSNRAASAPSTERLYPKASRPAAVAARSIEPPIRPRPSTHTGVFATPQGWHIRWNSRRPIGGRRDADLLVNGLQRD